MLRREWLSVAVALAFAGCGAGDSTDVPQADRRMIGSFRSSIEDRGYVVERLELNQEEERLELAYVTKTRDREERASEVWTVGSVFSVHVSRDVSFDRLDATALSADGDTVYRYHVETDWAFSFSNNEIDEETYLDLILDTIE